MFPSLRERAKDTIKSAPLLFHHQLQTANNSRPNLHTLKQLINLLITKLLSKRREHISQLPSTNVSIPFLVKHLETADKLLGRTGGLEAVWPVQDVQKGVKVDCEREEGGCVSVWLVKEHDSGVLPGASSMAVFPRVQLE